MKVYKKFGDISELYDYIKKKFPKVTDWGCMGSPEGDSWGDTKVWQSDNDTGNKKQAFTDALQYVSSYYLDGNTNFKPGTVISIEDNPYSPDVGYVMPMKPKDVPDIYKFKGQKAFDSVINSSPSATSPGDIQDYEALFKRSPELNTPENRKLLSNKILDDMKYGSNFSHFDKAQDGMAKLAEFFSREDMDKLVAYYNQLLDQDFDKLTKDGRDYKSHKIIKFATQFYTDQLDSRSKRMFSPQAVKTLKQMKSKAEQAETEYEADKKRVHQEKDTEYKRQRDEELKQKELRNQQQKAISDKFAQTKPKSELEAKVRANPRMVWDLPKGQPETMDMWVVAAQASPDILTFAPADVKAYVAQHGPEGLAESAQLYRIITLSGLK